MTYKREEGIPITGPVLHIKAHELHKRLSEVRGNRVYEEFTASSG